MGTFFAVPGLAAPFGGEFNQCQPHGEITPTLLSASARRSRRHSYYNSLRAGFAEALSGGLSFQLAYHFLEIDRRFDALDETLDLVDRRFTRGLSPNDVPHRFVASYLYDFQFARGYTGFAKTMLHGFSIGGITTFQSGTPFTVANVFDTVGTGGGVFSFADVGAPFERFDPRQSDARAFNPDAFRAFGDPAAGFNIATQFRASPTLYHTVLRTASHLRLIISKKTRWLEGESGTGH